MYFNSQYFGLNYQDKISGDIKQFQHTNWPEDSLPTIASGITGLISEVQNWNKSVGNATTIVHGRYEIEKR